MCGMDPELLREFLLPLMEEHLGAQDESAANLLAGLKFVENKASADGFPQTHVIRKESYR